MNKQYMYTLIFIILCSYSITFSKYIILWDVDDVLLTKNKQSEEYQQALSLRQLLGGVLPDIIFHPTLAWELYKMHRQGFGGEAFEAKAEEHGAHNLAATIKYILTSKQPVEGMENIVFSLGNQGYKQYIGTNMGKDGFFKVTDKFKDLFNYFEQPLDESQHMYVDYGSLKTALIHKPEQSYYDAWFDKMKQKDPNFNKTDVIFIDDKQVNLDGAKKAGIDNVILFQNVGQLKNDLQKLGINT